MNCMIDVIIPTYKPDMEFAKLIEKLQKQTIKPNKIILMNTEKKYIHKFLEESGILETYDNIEIHHVSEAEFDHGKTRDMGVQLSKAPYFLCMTQDAVPYDNNVIELHNFLFESEEYEISQEVLSYSQKISADTGR